jgi:hypothetical protein
VARKKSQAKQPGASLTIAIVGDGVTPRDVGLRQLASLLEATANAFESLAEERNVDPPQMSLARVKKGSAAYQLESHDRQAERTFSSFVTTVRKRGKDASPRTRQSLTRLHAVAARAGAGLRVDPEGPVGKKGTSAPVLLAPPLPEDEAKVEEGTVVFARVVGLRLDVRDRASVTLRYDDGGSGEFQSSSDLIEASAQLLGRHVEARVTFLRGETKDFDGELEQITQRDPSSDLMMGIFAARNEMRERGISIDAEAWLAEERDDEQPDRGD